MSAGKLIERADAASLLKSGMEVGVSIITTERIETNHKLTRKPFSEFVPESRDVLTKR